jgi:hypothetical protein|nr:MAG TPA_asm: hypothetical protein [Caudoviricetes sp.]
MERLTKREISGITYNNSPGFMCSCYCDNCSKGTGDCDRLKAMVNRLAKFEDLEEQGLLVRLPVAIGDDIYKIPSKANYDLNVLNGYKANNRVYHQKVYSIVFSQRGWFVQCDKDSIHAPNVICLDVEYGKTWFLTREEAEKKLEEMKSAQTSMD